MKRLGFLFLCATLACVCYWLFLKIDGARERTAVLEYVEGCYAQEKYTLAEMLLINLLLDKPSDKEALNWLSRIHQQQRNQPQPTAFLEELISRQSAELERNTAELDLLKKALLKLENLNAPESDYLTRYFLELADLEKSLTGLHDKQAEWGQSVTTALAAIQAEVEAGHSRLNTCLQNLGLLTVSHNDFKAKVLAEIGTLKTDLRDIHQNNQQDSIRLEACFTEIKQLQSALWQLQEASDSSRRVTDDYLQDLKSIQTMLHKLSDKYAQPLVPVEVSAPAGSLQAAASFEEEDLLAYTENGLAAYKAKEFTLAKHYLARALEMQAENPALHAIYAAALYAENPQDSSRMHEVISHAKKAVELDKSNKLAFETLAEVSESNGNPELAIDNYLEALRIDPMDEHLYYRIGKLYFTLGELVRAEYYFKEGLVIDKKAPATCYYLGKIQAEYGDADAAIHYWKETLAYDENYYIAYLEIGNCLLAETKYGEALVYLEKALYLKDDFFTSCKIGDCYWNLGEYAKAERSYKRILAEKDFFRPQEKKAGAALYEKLARRAFEKKAYTAAGKYAQQGLGLDKSAVSLYVLLGEICREERDYRESIKYLEHALALDSDFLQAQEALAATRLAAAELKEKQE